MKKGKWLVSLMLAVVCCFVALSFTACGDDDDGGDQAPRSEKVADEAAWRAAFDYSDITNYEWKETLTEKAEGSASNTFEMHYTKVRDGNKIKTVSGKNADGEEYTSYERYAPDEKFDPSLPDGAPNNGTAYDYEFDEEDNKWYYAKWRLYDDELNDVLWEGFSSFLDELDEDQEELIDRFDEFHYDETRGLYVLTIDELFYEYPDHSTQTTKNLEVTVFIQNGKVVKGTYHYFVKEDDEPFRESSVIWSLGKIGECSVTLPSAEPEPRN